MEIKLWDKKKKKYITKNGKRIYNGSSFIGIDNKRYDTEKFELQFVRGHVGVKADWPIMIYEKDLMLLAKIRKYKEIMKYENQI